MDMKTNCPNVNQMTAVEGGWPESVRAEGGLACAPDCTTRWPEWREAHGLRTVADHLPEPVPFTATARLKRPATQAV